MSKFSFVIALFMAGPAVAAPARQKIDYLVQQGGQTLGTERVEIAEEAGGKMVYRAATDLAGVGIKFQTTTTYENGGATAYELAGALPNVKDINIKLTHKKDGYQLTTTANSEISSKDFGGSKLVEVVDNNTAVHYARLARAYFSTKAVTIPILIPQIAQSGEMEIVDEGTRTIELHKKPIEVHLMRCRYVSGPIVELAVGLNHVLYRMSITAQNFSFVADEKAVAAYAKQHPGKAQDMRDPDEITAAGAREQHLSFQSDGLTIYATLTLPKAKTNAPVALLLGGSGPVSRDELVGAHKILADLAGVLAAQGVASLRYDKRYFTYRNIPAGIDPKPTFETDALNDARAAAHFLRNTPPAGVDAAQLLFVGHSQGCQVALALAAEPAPLKAMILLEPPTEDLDKAWLRQSQHLIKNRDHLEGAQADVVLAPLKTALAKVKAGADDPAAPVSALYYKSLAPYQPLKLAAKVNAPTLIVQGALDYQVTPAEAKALSEALSAAGKKVRYVEIEKMNHVLRKLNSDLSDGRDYADPGPIAPEARKAVGEFIVQTVTQPR